MEYDKRRTRWPWLFFYLVYISAVVYLLLSNNQYLYSHNELRLALAGEKVDTVQPVPQKESQIASHGEAGSHHWSRSTSERTGHEAGGVPHERAFQMEWEKPVGEGISDLSIDSWAMDDSGIYLTGKSPWAIAIDATGEVKWKFRFQTKKGGERGVMEPAIDSAVVYLVQPEGQVVALDKLSGKFKWKLELAQEIVSAPIIIGEEILMVIRPLSSEEVSLNETGPEVRKSSNKKTASVYHRLVKIKKNTGELMTYSQPFEVKGLANMTWARDPNLIFITADNKLYCLSVDGQLLWSQALPDPIEGPAIFAEGKVFVALTSGKIQAWDPGKKGKFEWEVDLDGAPQSAPTYIPFYQRLAIITADESMHMVDMKKAEHMWRFSLENRNLTHQVLAARLSARHIENLTMKWEKKGWTLWAPCAESRICIYNPDKGQLVGRISLPAPALSPPLFTGKAFYVVMQDKPAKDSKEIRFRLARFLDEDAYKRKQEAKSTSSEGH